MKKKKDDTLDTETTFADMNVEGFRWYKPEKKEGDQQLPPLTKEESRAMMLGAYSALLPILAGFLAILLIVAGLAWLWLR